MTNTIPDDFLGMYQVDAYESDALFDYVARGKRWGRLHLTAKGLKLPDWNTGKEQIGGAHNTFAYPFQIYEKLVGLKYCQVQADMLDGTKMFLMFVCDKRPREDIPDGQGPVKYCYPCYSGWFHAEVKAYKSRYNGTEKFGTTDAMVQQFLWTELLDPQEYERLWAMYKTKYGHIGHQISPRVVTTKNLRQGGLLVSKTLGNAAAAGQDRSGLFGSVSTQDLMERILMLIIISVVGVLTASLQSSVPGASSAVRRTIGRPNSMYA